MSKIQKALRVTRRRRKYADGGDTSDLSQNDQAAMMPETYVNPLVKQRLGTMLSLPQRAVDAAKNDVAHYQEHGMGDPDYTPEVIGPAAETAMQTLGNSGVRPSPGVSGVFVGPYGAHMLRDADRSALKPHPVAARDIAERAKNLRPEFADIYKGAAQDLRDAQARGTLEMRQGSGNLNDRDVWANSGWARGTAGDATKEIPDLGAKLVPLYKGSNKAALEHPAGDFHKLYDIPPIIVDPLIRAQGFKAHVNQATKQITVADEKDVSSVLHEVQHIIDKTEGASRAPQVNEVVTRPEMREEMFKAGPDRWGQQRYTFPPWQKDRQAEKFGSNQELLPDTIDPSNAVKLARQEVYLRSAGEVKPRNVQERRSRSYQYNLHPELTEDVSRGLQWVDKSDMPRPRREVLDQVRKSLERDRELSMPDFPKYKEYKAGGGGVGNFNPERASAFGLAHQGAIKSSVPGRTDKLNLDVASGSSVVPADVVSGLGQGNSDAGHAILSKMFTSGPYGMNLPKAKAGSRVGPRKSSLSKMSFTKSGYADGGETGNTPIVAAGGEHVITPDQVMAVGGGDLDLGHKFLNRWYENTRAKTIQQMKSLKPPKNG